jgi:hypothetical protein
VTFPELIDQAKAYRRQVLLETGEAPETWKVSPEELECLQRTFAEQVLFGQLPPWNGFVYGMRVVVESSSHVEFP